MQIPTIKIGARASKLAQTMAAEVKAALLAKHDLAPQAVEIKAIITKGDRIQDRALMQLGGKGLFTKEIEDALIEGEIDIAVHSTKDMPTLLPQNLKLEAFLPREDARDGFIGAKVKHFADLPIGATIGTAGLRRQALAQKLRPDLTFTLLRGNVETRLKKLQDHEFDGTFLAMAGVKRLGLADAVSEIMDPEIFVPPPGQGAIALQTRSLDEKIDGYVAAISDEATKIALRCERQFLATLDGSCRTPLGGYARISGDNICFNGIILSPCGAKSYAITCTGTVDEAAQIGDEAAKKLRLDAGAEFFRDWHC